MLEIKNTSNGRRPQNIKMEYLSNHWSDLPQFFKLKLRGPKQNQQSLKWRRLTMEDDLKILKIEYLSNHWSDLSQILNLSSGDQTKIKNVWNGRRPNNIKSWISQQQLIGSFSNFELKLRGPNQYKNCLKWRGPPMEDELKILKV